MYSDSNYKWITAVGALFTLISFFMAFFNINVLGIPIGISLSTIASLGGQFLLFFLPLAMVGVAIFALIPPADDKQARSYLIIELVAWILGILFMGIALISLYSRLDQGGQAADFFGSVAGDDLFGLGEIGEALELFSITPGVGLFLFLFGNIAIIAGLIMGWNQLGYADEWDDGGITVEEDSDRSSVNRKVRRPRQKDKVQAWLTNRDGHSFQLNKGRTRIGRLAENDVCISDPTIGRRHAIIEEQKGHYRLTDLASKNHTWLNGRMLRQPTMLHPNDEMRFGDTYTVRFLASGR